MKRLDECVLVRGTNPRAMETGRGCVMNIVSMLTGGVEVSHIYSYEQDGMMPQKIEFFRGVNDAPSCVSPPLRGFAIALNDAFLHHDAERTAALVPLIPLLMETKTHHEGQRAHYDALCDGMREMAESGLFGRPIPCHEPSLMHPERILCQMLHIMPHSLKQTRFRILGEATKVLRAACLVGMPEFDVLEREEKSAVVSERGLEAVYGSGPWA